MSLRPVTFRYKRATADGSRPIQYGLIAEEVAKIYPDLVQYDKQGKPFTVYYHLLTPMLLNELQKEHRRVAEQSAAIVVLKRQQLAEVTALKSELATLAATQHREDALLAKLAAFVETGKDRTTARKTAIAQR